MDMQEPEEQRLEDEPMELSEEVSEPSDETALSDSSVSEPDEEPAPDALAGDEAEEASAEDEPEEETASDPSSRDDANEELGSSMDEDSEPEQTEAEPVDETNQDVPVEAEETSVEPESEVEAPVAASLIADVDSVPAEEKTEPAPKPDDDPSAWFVVHCYSGYENKVRHNLEQRIETMGMKDMIFDVIIPTQEEIEVRDGKRRTVERHIFPGYVLVNMILTEESWYVVRNTPGVTGFVGMGNNPTPLRPEEVSQIVKRMEADAPTVKVTFKVGERVRIVDGPFNDFRGVVSEIDMERTKVRVMVSFFGRETPVELDFLQVEKA
jgi:transcriptional antiterminator NusG